MMKRIILTISLFVLISCEDINNEKEIFNIYSFNDNLYICIKTSETEFKVLDYFENKNVLNNLPECPFDLVNINGELCYFDIKENFIKIYNKENNIVDTINGYLVDNDVENIVFSNYSGNINKKSYNLESFPSGNYLNNVEVIGRVNKDGKHLIILNNNSYIKYNLRLDSICNYSSKIYLDRHQNIFSIIPENDTLRINNKFIHIPVNTVIRVLEAFNQLYVIYRDESVVYLVCDNGKTIEKCPFHNDYIYEIIMSNDSVKLAYSPPNQAYYINHEETNIVAQYILGGEQVVTLKYVSNNEFLMKNGKNEFLLSNVPRIIRSNPLDEEFVLAESEEESLILDKNLNTLLATHGEIIKYKFIKDFMLVLYIENNVTKLFKYQKK